jgi:predicted DNA-binding protein YlxM (UPF0122 family)
MVLRTLLTQKQVFAVYLRDDFFKKIMHRAKTSRIAIAKYAENVKVALRNFLYALRRCEKWLEYLKKQKKYPFI